MMAFSHAWDVLKDSARVGDERHTLPHPHPHEFRQMQTEAWLKPEWAGRRPNIGGTPSTNALGSRGYSQHMGIGKPAAALGGKMADFPESGPMPNQGKLAEALAAARNQPPAPQLNIQGLPPVHPWDIDWSQPQVQPAPAPAPAPIIPDTGTWGV